MGRLLAHGDLRTVVLLLIEEQARHGYELIKLIEEKSSGQYAPSPGVIYPTLTYLEETGFVKTKEENGKKQYSITAEGKEFLDENRELAESILKRLEQIGAERAKAETEEKEPLGRGQHAEVRNAFHALRNALRNPSGKAAKRKKEILAVLEKARAEIEALLREGE
jgi:DNA-binding PadR family transcriptional regulator